MKPTAYELAMIAASNGATDKAGVEKALNLFQLAESVLADREKQTAETDKNKKVSFSELKNDSSPYYIAARDETIIGYMEEQAKGFRQEINGIKLGDRTKNAELRLAAAKEYGLSIREIEGLQRIRKTRKSEQGRVNRSSASKRKKKISVK